MQRRYVAKLSRQEAEKRRLAAGRELLRGHGQRGNQARVAKKYGVSRPTALRWERIALEEGLDGLRSTKAKGAPPKLTDQQRERLRTILLQGALKQGFDTDAWTAKRVARIIEREFGVKYAWKYIPQLLREQLGFSWQKPERKAREIDPAKVEAWLKNVWEPVKRGRSTGSGASGSSTSLVLGSPRS